MNGNIKNIVNVTNFCLLKQFMWVNQQKMFCNILLLLGFFSEVINNGSKNSNLFVKRSILPKLPLSIILKKLLNTLFKPFNKNSRLKKEKPIIIIIFWDLVNSDYIMNQSASIRF